MFKIDGKEYIHGIINIKRSFQILDGENAGRLIITAKMERDILGTFYNYNATIDKSFLTAEEYDELYETLSAPVDSHIIEVPFGQETITYEAYVTSGSDTLQSVSNYDEDNQELHWSDLQIDFIAVEPQRRPA